MLPGRNWVTVLDFDFTAQPNQTLGSDGFFTIGGLPWNKQNSANDAVAMAVVNGSGLVVQPVANTNYAGLTRTLPTLWLPFIAIPAMKPIEYMSALRLWVHVAAYNGSASFDNAIAAIDSNNLGALGFQIDRGTNASAAQSISLQQQGSGTVITPGTGFATGNTLTLGGTNNVMVMTIPLFMGTSFYASFGGFGLAAGKTWPEPQDLNAICLSAGTAAGYNTFQATGPLSFNVPASAFGIALGAKRQGSATALSVTYGHVRLDVAA